MAASAEPGSRVPPSFAVHTTIAGTDSEVRKAFCASMALVDSALRGRKAAWSLVETSPSRPAKGRARADGEPDEEEDQGTRKRVRREARGIGSPNYDLTINNLND